MDEMWLIWSEEHRAWWAPNHNGYVQSRKQAGQYTYEDACDIVKGANRSFNDVPNEAMVRAESWDGE